MLLIILKIFDIIYFRALKENEYNFGNLSVESEYRYRVVF